MSGQKNKKLTIVEGNSNLDISPVYTHLNVGKPKPHSAPKNSVVIPKEKNNKKKKR